MSQRSKYHKVLLLALTLGFAHNSSAAPAGKSDESPDSRAVREVYSIYKREGSFDKFFASIEEGLSPEVRDLVKARLKDSNSSELTISRDNSGALIFKTKSSLVSMSVRSLKRGEFTVNQKPVVIDYKASAESQLQAIEAALPQTGSKALLIKSVLPDANAAGKNSAIPEAGLSVFSAAKNWFDCDLTNEAVLKCAAVRDQLKVGKSTGACTPDQQKTYAETIDFVGVVKNAPTFFCMGKIDAPATVATTRKDGKYLFSSTVRALETCASEVQAACKIAPIHAAPASRSAAPKAAR